MVVVVVARQHVKGPSVPGLVWVGVIKLECPRNTKAGKNESRQSQDAVPGGYFQTCSDAS